MLPLDDLVGELLDLESRRTRLDVVEGDRHQTFQDLCRAASVHDFVARSISGHATLEMQTHYSSGDGAEVLAKVISPAGFREARDQAVAAGAPSSTEVMIENSAITTESGDQTKEGLTMRSA